MAQKDITAQADASLSEATSACQWPVEVRTLFGLRIKAMTSTIDAQRPQHSTPANNPIRHVQKVRPRLSPSHSRFSIKEDVSGSTSLKSSVQRHVRNSLLEQLPLLSKPAYKEGGAAAPAPEPVAEAAPKEEEDDEPKGGKGKKGGKGGKGKGGKKGKGKKDDDEPAAAADDDEVTVLDEIWPKKDALGLTKWYALLRSPLFLSVALTRQPREDKHLHGPVCAHLLQPL